MQLDDLNEYQLNTLLELKLTFTKDDWEKLDDIVTDPALTDLQKNYQLEQLKLNAHNRYVNTYGKQPNGGYDPDLEGLL
jgi:hypothetical protein